MKKKVEYQLKHHLDSVENCHRLSKRYLDRRDYNEAARWADAAKSHRFAAETLKELLAL